jgi:hypothetical protein
MPLGEPLPPGLMRLKQVGERFFESLSRQGLLNEIVNSAPACSDSI